MWRIFYSWVGTQILSLFVHPEHLRGVECLLKPLACHALANWGNGPFIVIFPVCLKCLVQRNCSELFSHVFAVKMNTSVRTSVFSTFIQVYMRKISWLKCLFKITQVLLCTSCKMSLEKIQIVHSHFRMSLPSMLKNLRFQRQNVKLHQKWVICLVFIMVKQFGRHAFGLFTVTLLW